MQWNVVYTSSAGNVLAAMFQPVVVLVCGLQLSFIAVGVC
jgi:fumarate reductase subunit D